MQKKIPIGNKAYTSFYATGQKHRKALAKCTRDWLDSVF